VQLQDPGDLLFAQQTMVRADHGGILRTLRCFPLANTWRSKSGEKSVGKTTIIDYLVSPSGTQLRLPDLTAQEHGR